MRGNTGLSEVTGRAFGYGNVDIDRGNEQNEKFSFGNERNLFIQTMAKLIIL